MIKNEYDVVITGAGPAGTSTAKECAKAGLSVLVLEKKEEIGAPKRCAEGLSDNSVKELGLNIPENCKRRHINGAVAYSPKGREIKVSYDGTEGYVLERKLFDKWLAEEAVRAGAKIIAKTEVVDVIKENDFVTGVHAIINGEKKEIKCKILVAADGVESTVMRMAGIRTNKNPDLVDSGYQYEMAGIDIEHPDMIVLYFGSSIAPRGYVWIFPKENDVANVGIGINGNHEKTAKQYLDEFIENNEGLRKGSIIEVNAGSIPVGGLMKNMVSNGIIGVGDSVNQVNPIHGGGIGESIKSSRIAGNVIKKAFDRNDFSEKVLKEYDELWWKQRGKHLKNIEKVREIFEKMTDDNMEDLVDALQGEDLYDMAHGKLAKLAKILVKYKMKGLARSLGV